MQQFQPGRFEVLPVVIKNLLIINALVFLAQVTIGKQYNIEDLFALHTWQSQLFQPWQFITHMFMHGSVEHLIGNMFALWMFGAVLENLWGPKRFITFYIVCGLGAAFAHMIVLFYQNQIMINQFKDAANEIGYLKLENFISKYSPVPGLGISKDIGKQVLDYHLNQATLGASGAVFGCLAAFGYLFPNNHIYISFLFPVKAKWAVLGYAVFELTMAVSNSAGDNVAHIAHLGGALVGFLLVFFWNKTNRKTFY